MKTITLLLLTACNSGEPFTVAWDDDVSSNADAATREEVYIVPERDAGGDVEVGDAKLDASADAVSDVKCTSLASSWQCDNIHITGPDYACERLGSQPKSIVTPIECRCLETYNCACIMARRSTCSSGAPIDKCEDIGGPILSCDF